MDGIREIGKYIKKTAKNTDLSLKRDVEPEKSVERIRDIFDSQDSFKANIVMPPEAKKVTLGIDFGKKLPSLGCCGDCMCGITESYTSDSLINGSIFVTTPYVPDSTVIYLDGVLSTKNVHYAEVNPLTGQIAILIPTSTIVISYVYTVGNCTEAICIDEKFECLPYSIFGLLTVFSDRYDRTNGGSYPSGGCGVYRTTNISNPTLFEPVMSGGLLTSTGFRAMVGGDNVLAGGTFEIIARVKPAGLSTGFQFGTGGSGSFGQAKFSVGVDTAGMMSVGFQGYWRSLQVFSGGSTSYVDRTVIKSTSTTVPWIAGTSYWVRCTQNGLGMSMTVWPSNTTEPGVQSTLTLADINLASFPDISEPRMLAPALNYLGLGGNSMLEAIQVGAALDAGDWTLSAGGGSHGAHCSAPPGDGYTRPVSYCNPETNTVTFSNAVLPSLGGWLSYPVFVSEDGLSDVIDLAEVAPGASLSVGHPSSIIVTGKVRAVISDQVEGYGSVAVQFKTFGSAPTLMTVGGLIGGGSIGAANVPVNGDSVPVSFVIPGGQQDVAWWGMGYTSLGSFVAGLPLMSFLNFMSVELYDVQAKAMASVRCSAQPFCLCLEE